MFITANLYILWNNDVIPPRLHPSQTPLRPYDPMIGQKNKGY